MATQILFDGWTLLPSTGELSRNGAARRLQTQSLQVLLFLLRRPGELVTRDELVAHLWPDTVVDFEAGLNAVVRKLRIALDDDADRPSYIETIPRRGYRYVGSSPVERIASPDASPPPSPHHSPALPSARALSKRHAVIAVILMAGLVAIGALRFTTPRPLVTGPNLAPAGKSTYDPTAYDSYLKARLAYRDGDWLTAAERASAAIAHDAAFGQAYLTRAAATGMAIVFNEDASETRLTEMKRDLQQAARLVGKRDAMFAAVDAMYASIGDRDHMRALARFDEAKAAGLSDPTLLRTRAMQQVVINRLDDAIAAHRDMAALDPDNFVLVNMTAVLLSMARRPDEALRMSRLVRERFPRQPVGDLTHARLVFAFSGRTSEWREAFERTATHLSPDQRLLESFDLLRYEGRERELLDRLIHERTDVVSAGTFNSLTLCCVGSRPVAEYTGWAALLNGDTQAAARAGQLVLAFVTQSRPTRWNDWYLKLLEAEGLLMTGRRHEATTVAAAAVATVERQHNAVQWRYAAAVAARVFAWGNEKDRAVALLEALDRARPGLRPAEITHDPLYRIPLSDRPRYRDLSAALQREISLR